MTNLNFFSAVTLALSLLSGLCTVSGFYEDCVVHNYTGGPGEVLATFEPTLPGKISLNSSSSAWDIASDIASNIPVVGGALGSMFDLIGIGTSTTVKNMQMLEKAINTLIDDITKTVNDLKDYVDAKFEEYDYDQKTTKLHGILYSAGYCASFGLPSNQEECLKNLNVDIVELVPEFFPVDPKYETFEQLLPLTRHYIDLQMAVLIDIVNLTNKDQDYVKSIATFSVMAYNFYVTSVETICDEHVKTSGDRPFTYERIGEFNSFGKCFFNIAKASQEWDHGDGCSQYNIEEDLGSCDVGDCWTCAEAARLNSGLKTSIDVNRKYFYNPMLKRTIKAYWQADMGQAMENYKKIGIMAGAKEEDFLVLKTFESNPITYDSYLPVMEIYIDELIETSMKYKSDYEKKQMQRKRKLLGRKKKPRISKGSRFEKKTESC